MHAAGKPGCVQRPYNPNRLLLRVLRISFSLVHSMMPVWMLSSLREARLSLVAQLSLAAQLSQER